MKVDPDAPYSLADEAERARRRILLSQPHMRPLEAFCRSVEKQRSATSLPNFDPCDGGVSASILVMLEAPGPKAVGSEFISRNNPDPTAKNVNLLLQEADLPRENTALWNVIPWYIGSKDQQNIRQATKADLAESAPYLLAVLPLFVNLRAVVLMGKAAQKAEEIIIKSLSVPIFKTAHPSRRGFIVPSRRTEALEVFRGLRRFT